MLTADDDLSQSRRKQYLWLAYGGWLSILLLVLGLKELDYSGISYGQLAILLAAATSAHIISYALVYFGIDRYFTFDPHFVFIPNWVFTAPMVAFGYYALGDARDLMHVGWLMGIFFCAGYMRFRGVVLTASWYISLYLGVLLFAPITADDPVDILREGIRSAVYFAVCVIVGLLFERFASQKEYLKESLHSLREKDRIITLLNRKLAKFVTTPLVEELAKGESDAVLSHQRRKVTIFFSDIQGFSIITDASEPEEMAHLLNEYFSEMIHIVYAFGGTVDKLMGDGMMVLFGAPVSVDPSLEALRCVQMAVSMQERLKRLNERWQSLGWPHPLQVRMGINTGLSIVGSFGSDAWSNYTAIGSQVNIAARLQQKAEPGQILLSHSTHALVANSVKVKKLGEMLLKGSHYPVQVYQLERLADGDYVEALEWHGPGLSISIQPQTLDIPEKEHLLEMLKKHLGKPDNSF